MIYVITKRTGTIIASFHKRELGKAIRYAGSRNAFLQWAQ